MTATFNPALPAALDRVRQNTGDIDVNPATNALNQDETINALLTSYGNNEYAVSAKLCRDISLRLGLSGDTKNLSLSVGMGPAEFYRKEADRFDLLAAAAGGGISTGGRLESDYTNLEQDSSVRQPDFTTTQHDHPGTSSAPQFRIGGG
jgi:hypothetical protein